MWDWLSNIGSSIKAGWNKLVGNSTDDKPSPSKMEDKSGSKKYIEPEKSQSVSDTEDSSGGWLSGIWDSLKSGWQNWTGWGNQDMADQTLESVYTPPSVEKDPPPAYAKEDPYPTKDSKAPEMDPSNKSSIDDVDDSDSDVLHEYHKEAPSDPIYPDSFRFLVPNPTSMTSGALLSGIPSGFFTSTRPSTPGSTLEGPVIIAPAPTADAAPQKNTIFHGFGGAFLIAVIVTVVVCILYSCCGSFCCPRPRLRRQKSNPEDPEQPPAELGEISPPVDDDEPRYPPPVANISRPSSCATSVKDLPPYEYTDPLPAPKYPTTSPPEYYEGGRAMLG
jgi:hypothetical protein